MDEFLSIQVAHLQSLGWITLMGAFGGLVHGMRGSAGIALPHVVEHAFRPGILADIVIGIAGGLAIFLLVPGNFNISGESATSVLKSFGFALIGGYGGPFILDRALGATIAEMKETINDQESRMKRRLEQEAIDHEAIRMVDLQLSDTAQAVVPEEKLTDVVKRASPITQEHIREKTATRRRMAWQRQSLDPSMRFPGLMERTIPIFRALVEAPDSGDSERCLTQLAYALKDQAVPDWSGALHYMDRAIKLLPSHRAVPHHYAYTWVLAAIHDAVGKRGTDVGLIEERLRHALSFAPLLQGFQKELQGDVGTFVIPWLKQNGIDLGDLGIDLDAIRPGEEATAS